MSFVLDAINDPDTLATLLVERMLSTATRCPEDIANWIADEIRQAIKRENEACARLIEGSIIGYGANEPYLRPRPSGDVGGLAYAVAIRKRTT